MAIFPNDDFGESNIESPIHITHSLKTVADALGVNDIRGLSLIVSRWESVVGREASLVSRVCSLKNQVLTVEVDCPAWLEDLQTRSTEIADKIVKYTGVICRTRFVPPRPNSHL